MHHLKKKLRKGLQEEILKEEYDTLRVNYQIYSIPRAVRSNLKCAYALNTYINMSSYVRGYSILSLKSVQLVSAYLWMFRFTCVIWTQIIIKGLRIFLLIPRAFNNSSTRPALSPMQIDSTAVLFKFYQDVGLF